MEEGSESLLLTLLPRELQEEVWMWLPPRDFFNQQLVCSLWRHYALDDTLWYCFHRRYFGGPKKSTTWKEDVYNEMKACNEVIANVDHTDKRILLWAARNGHFSIIEKILKRFPNMKDRSALLDFPIIDEEAAKEPLQIDGTSPIPEDIEMTPLLLASFHGHTAAVKTLLSLGASPKASSRVLSSLYIACRRGHLEVVKLLICPPAPAFEGASPLEPCPNGSPPLLVAAGGGHLSIVTYLMDNFHPDVNCERIDFHITPLWVAAQEGHMEVVKYLYQHGAKVDEKDRKGATPLMVACERGHLEIVTFLVENGADLTKTEKSQGKFPLYLAAMHADWQLVKYLLEKLKERGQLHDKTAGVNGFLPEGWFTPLFAACQQGKTKSAEILLDYEATIDQATSEGGTPLVVAIYKNHHETVGMLVDRGASLTRRYMEYTPLHMAVISMDVNMVALLLSKGSDPNVTRTTYETPLLDAVHRNNLEIVKLLVAAGADVNYQTPANSLTLLLGRTALEKAIHKQNEEIIAFLKAHGAKEEEGDQKN